MHPCQGRITPVSSRCVFLFRVHPPPPSSHPRPECCLSPPSALLSSGGEKNEISPPWPIGRSTVCVPVSARRQQAYALLSRWGSERDCSRIRTASGGQAVYLGLGCTSTSTFGDRAKCSMTSCISCVNRSVESSSAEGRVGRAGDGAGETERPGGDGGDMCDDDGGSGAEFE